MPHFWSRRLQQKAHMLSSPGAAQERQIWEECWMLLGWDQGWRPKAATRMHEGLQYVTIPCPCLTLLTLGPPLDPCKCDSFWIQHGLLASQGKEGGKPFVRMTACRRTKLGSSRRSLMIMPCLGILICQKTLQVLWDQGHASKLSSYFDRHVVHQKRFWKSWFKYFNKTI